ncbi:ABC transporter ATP-binding protein [Bifidobacterium pseudolongum subsp. globosum]|uniref:ATP-binding cassette domain-containing protein n=1 Tax=Bifidobacterium pseudolongum TaxID=1694 RepID=UPI0010213626|nr:ATP-binding cassette domain-containing protein [Bifidobacterium pseudolongum]RYQ29676.1 ABC transporter ATP-binding protein [Bifidobacterium pseudolongum subsp. globosum]
MSDKQHDQQPDAVEELDELMTEDSAEPTMQYTIEYDDDKASAGELPASDAAGAEDDAPAASSHTDDAQDAGVPADDDAATDSPAATADDAPDAADATDADNTSASGATPTQTHAAVADSASSQTAADDADASDTADDDPGTPDANAAASAVALTLDRELRADPNNVDDSVFRAYPMFAMHDVTVADGKTGEHIWSHLSFQCEAGTAYGVLVDPADARRHDALVALMAGFAYPNEGEVMTKSTSFNELHPLELRGHRMGVLLQQYAMRGDLSAAANLEYVMDASSRNYLKPIPVLAQDLLTRVGFAQGGDDDSTQSDRSRALVRTLDPVERARVMVARAIATDPDIVLADEPTATLDDTDASTILALLRAQVSSESKRRTVIVVTTDPGVAGQMDEMIDLTH